MPSFDATKHTLRRIAFFTEVSFFIMTLLMPSRIYGLHFGARVFLYAHGHAGKNAATRNMISLMPRRCFLIKRCNGCRSAEKYLAARPARRAGIHAHI